VYDRIMKYPVWQVVLGMIFCGAALFAQTPAAASGGQAKKELPPHKVQFVSVADDVKLEVIDWGGTGRPLVLLAGLGRTAHTFHQFAPKLTQHYRVYGITRRGFGESTVATSGYATDELGDDVVKVLDALGLKKPVLAGHSFAGAELSSIATRYPGKAAGVIYLDAGYSYAFYDKERGDTLMDTIELKKKIEEALFSIPPDGVRLIDEVLSDLPRLEKNLREIRKWRAEVPTPAGGWQPLPAPIRAMKLGTKKFTAIPGPVLAIYAFSETESSGEAAVEKEALVKAFEVGVPTARVVRIANAKHDVHNSNPEEVLREMRAFIDALP
jgi:non-heme chloroperoxidase